MEQKTILDYIIERYSNPTRINDRLRVKQFSETKKVMKMSNEEKEKNLARNLKVLS